MTYSRGGAPAPGVQRGGQAVPAVEGHQPAVGVRAAVPARPGAADHRVLHPERPRAPEPVGIPAPEVVADREEVLLRAADRLVVDALPGVVAEPRRHVAERADGQVHLVEAERGAVHEVRPVPAQAAVPGDLRDRLHARVRVVEAEVPQVHERRGRLEFDGERERVAERAVGVGEPPVEGGVLVPLGGGDHPAVAGEDLHLGHRLVRQAVAQRGGLDAQPGDRAAERDRLQLGHDQRHQAVLQGGVGQVLVGRHAADDRRAGRRVHAQHAPERGHVQAGRRAAVPEPEQVRRALGQADRLARRDRRVGAPQLGHRRLVARVRESARCRGRARILRAGDVGQLSPPLEVAHPGGVEVAPRRIRGVIRALPGPHGEDARRRALSASSAPPRSRPRAPA